MSAVTVAPVVVEECSFCVNYLLTFVQMVSLGGFDWVSEVFRYGDKKYNPPELPVFPIYPTLGGLVQACLVELPSAHKANEAQTILSARGYRVLYKEHLVSLCGQQRGSMRYDSPLVALGSRFVTNEGTRLAAESLVYAEVTLQKGRCLAFEQVDTCIWPASTRYLVTRYERRRKFRSFFMGGYLF